MFENIKGSRLCKTNFATWFSIADVSVQSAKYPEMKNVLHFVCFLHFVS